MEIVEAQVSTDLIVPEGFLPEIDQGVKDTILKDSELTTLWLKPGPSGFTWEEKNLPELVGVICDIDVYWCFWEDNKPHKSWDETAPDDSFERRCDVTVLTDKGQRFGISLAPSSYLHHFCPYIKGLAGMDLEPEKVVTRFTCKEITGKFGTFCIVRPEMVSDLEPSEEANMVNVSDDDIPF